MSAFRTCFLGIKRHLYPVESIFACELFHRLNKIAVTFCKMSTSSESKYNWSITLVCPDGNHDPIKLQHQEALFVGRCPETRIVDPRCSRKQVKLFGDLITGEVQVTQTAVNSSVLDGIEMIKDKVYSMKHSSTLHILAGLYPQKLLVKQLRQNDKKHSPEVMKKHSSSEHRVRDEKKKSSPKDETKSSKKRKSSHEDLNEGETKKPRLSESDKEKNKSKTDKLKSKPKGDNDRDTPKEKKPKLKENGDISKSKADSMEGEEYLKDVAEKLNKLKSNAKVLRTPSKDKTISTNHSKEYPSSSSSSLFLGAVASPPMTKGPATSSRWDNYDSLYVYTSKGLEGKEKIAAFDIDGTIIETQSGKKFPTHPGDWRMKFNNQVSKKIRKHHEDGYKIVFFTNQMGVSRGKTKMPDLKAKFADVLEEINVPIQIFVSTKGGIYRKPCLGMWEFLVNKGNNGVPVDCSQCFFVGDAAGRPVNWAPKKKKDFSCSDRLFALNIGIEFYSPEEFFIGYPSSKFQLPPFDPRKVSSETPLLDPPGSKLASKGKEVIVLTGCPASGKSHFAKKHLVPKGYAYVNRDTLGSWQKCVTACKDNLKKDNSVVIDNTNPDEESRARYLKVASGFSVPCRCFVMSTTLDQAKHNERFREITDKSHAPVNDIIMNGFKGKYKPPSLTEGFTQIVTVNFVTAFHDKKEEKIYKMFLMEK